MKIDDAIPAVLERLPAHIRAQLEEITIEHRPAPTSEDYARGATDGHQGYFFGAQHEPVQTTELPDEESPRGVIVIFTGRIRPFTLFGLTRVLLHEVAHVLGFEEETIVHEMGLGA